MRILIRTSDHIARIEEGLLRVLIAGTLGLMILNVISRALRQPIYWVDELAINGMVIGAFVGSSLMFSTRQHFSVTLLKDAVSPRLQVILSLLVQCCNLALAGFMAYAVWLWFDPVALVQSGFNLDAFFKTTFNSVYQEITNTIGIRRLWFFLIMPVITATIFIHSLAGIVKDATALSLREY